jgi:Rrf2 family iron-sulfur cluster assembly transcriptional regulator
VDEPIDATSCGGKENCHDDQKCITHDLWAGLNEQIFEYLSSVKLATLVDKQKERRAGHTGPVQFFDMREKRETGTVPA